MKFYTVLSMITLSVMCSFITGCAAGSATAGYALKSQSADSLTASAEERLVNRVKREIMQEIATKETTI